MTELTELAIHKQMDSGRDAKGRFVAGTTGTVKRGRPMGIKHNLSRAFLTDLALHWQEEGGDILKRVTKDDPAAVLRVVASLVPKEMITRLELSDATDAPAIRDITPEQATQLARLQHLRLLAEEAEDGEVIEVGHEEGRTS